MSGVAGKLSGAIGRFHYNKWVFIYKYHQNFKGTYVGLVASPPCTLRLRVLAILQRLPPTEPWGRGRGTCGCGLMWALCAHPAPAFVLFPVSAVPHPCSTSRLA